MMVVQVGRYRIGHAVNPRDIRRYGNAQRLLVPTMRYYHQTVFAILPCRQVTRNQLAGTALLMAATAPGGSGFRRKA